MTSSNNPLAMFGNMDTDSEDEEDQKKEPPPSMKSFESDDDASDGADKESKPELSISSSGGGGGGGGALSQGQLAKLQALEVKNKMLDDMVSRLRVKTKQYEERLETLEKDAEKLEGELKDSVKENEENEKLVEDLQFTIMRMQTKKDLSQNDAASLKKEGEESQNEVKNKIREFQAQIRLTSKANQNEAQMARELADQKARNARGAGGKVAAAVQGGGGGGAVAQAECSKSSSEVSSSSGGGGGGAMNAELAAKAEELAKMVEELQANLNSSLEKMAERERGFAESEATFQSQLKSKTDTIVELEAKLAAMPGKFDADMKKVKEEKNNQYQQLKEAEDKLGEMEQEMANLKGNLEEQRVLLGEGNAPKIFPYALKEGPLTKCGSRVKNWKKRFFILTSTSLRYFDPKDVHLGSKPAGEILLVGSASVAKSNEKPFAFTVTTGSRSLVLYSASSQDTEEWITAIKEVLNNKTSARKSTAHSKLGAPNIGGLNLSSPSAAAAKTYFSTKKGICSESECNAVAYVRGLCRTHFEVYEKKCKKAHQFKDSIKEGLLTKKGAQVKSHKERYFALSKSSLRYYKPDEMKGDATPAGQISLDSGCIVEVCPKEAGNQKFAFSICPNSADGTKGEGRTLIMFAHSEEDADEWVRALKRAGGDDSDEEVPESSSAGDDGEKMSGELVKFTKGGKGKHVKYFVLKMKKKQVCWGDTRSAIKYVADVQGVHNGLSGCDAEKMGLNKQEIARSFTLATSKKELLLLAPTMEDHRAWMDFAVKCTK